MRPSFDLSQEPWLPCVGADGHILTVSIADALVHAHELRELHGSTPLETAALHRLLLAILHRIFGPDSRRAWAELWQAGRCDESAIRAYLQQWRDRFDLFDDAHPFQQTPEVQAQPRPISGLDLSRAYNNATLFEHQMEDGSLSVSPAQAARWLVTFQCSGIGTGPPHDPYYAGPLANAMIVMLQGRTLFQTLMLNLLEYHGDRPMPAGPDDRPMWEYDECPYPPSLGRFYRPGYLAYLTWRCRTARLLPHWEGGVLTVRECQVAQGPAWDSSLIEDPMKVYVRDDRRGSTPLRLREDRAMWRDSDALFRLHDASFRPPLAFRELAEHVSRGTLAREEVCNYVVLGILNDNANLKFYREERMPLPLAYLADDEQGDRLRGWLFQALDAAERVGDALGKAGRELAAWVASPADRRKANANDIKLVVSQLRIESRYWPRLELAFQRLVSDLPMLHERALDAWLDTVLLVARRAFEEAAEATSDPTRGLKAANLARATLERLLAKGVRRKEELHD